MSSKRETESMGDALFSLENVSLSNTERAAKSRLAWLVVFLFAAFVMITVFQDFLGFVAAVVGIALVVGKSTVSSANTRWMYVVMLTLVMVPVASVLYVLGLGLLAVLLWVGGIVVIVGMKK